MKLEENSLTPDQIVAAARRGRDSLFRLWRTVDPDRDVEILTMQLQQANDPCLTVRALRQGVLVEYEGGTAVEADSLSEALTTIESRKSSKYGWPAGMRAREFALSVTEDDLKQVRIYTQAVWDKAVAEHEARMANQATASA